MAGRIEARLRELGHDLPKAPGPAGSYVPWVISGNQVWIAGQGPWKDGAFHYKGRIGAELSLEDGQAAARLVGLALIAQLKEACGGDLDRVVRFLKLTGYVLCTPEFTQHPQVINGCSDLLVEVFGDKGRHARVAVGASSLPLGFAVEIDAVVEIG